MGGQPHPNRFLKLHPVGRERGPGKACVRRVRQELTMVMSGLFLPLSPLHSSSSSSSSVLSTALLSPFQRGLDPVPLLPRAEGTARTAPLGIQSEPFFSLIQGSEQMGGILSVAGTVADGISWHSVTWAPPSCRGFFSEPGLAAAGLHSCWGERGRPSKLLGGPSMGAWRPPATRRGVTPGLACHS